jgi:Protein of unknown function (DUF559)
MDSSVFRRADVLKQGHTRGYIDHAVASGRWINLHRGVYVDTASPDMARSIVCGHLIACGLDAALSHFSAATIHQFDSTHGFGATVYVTARKQCGVKCGSTQLAIIHSYVPIQSTTIEGLPVTTRARTLLDLAGRVDDIECERLLESAFRGADPKRPHRWRTNVLAELLLLMKAYPRHPGASRARRVLILRPVDCRPTGSFPETVLLQALREVGVEVIRQPTLVVKDDSGRRFEYYPDFVIVAGRCIVEIDGAEHLKTERSRKDAARQNRLIGFDVFRYPAATILRDPSYAVAELLTHVRQVRNASSSWTESGRVVRGAGNDWSIVPAGTG